MSTASSVRGSSWRLLVAGTAGGVGTTTVTALVFSTLRDRSPEAPVLLDHTAGTLGARLADGDEVRQLDQRLVLHDLGRQGVPVGIAALADQAVVLIVVAAATPIGCVLAQEAVTAVAAEHGADGLSRTVLALVGVHGRYRIARHVRDITATPDLRGVVVVPRDLALAAGGRIPLARLTRPTRAAVDELLDLLQAGSATP